MPGDYVSVTQSGTTLVSSATDTYSYSSTLTLSHANFADTPILYSALINDNGAISTSNQTLLQDDKNTPSVVVTESASEPANSSGDFPVGDQITFDALPVAVEDDSTPAPGVTWQVAPSGSSVYSAVTPAANHYVLGTGSDNDPTLTLTVQAGDNNISIEATVPTPAWDNPPGTITSNVFRIPVESNSAFFTDQLQPQTVVVGTPYTWSVTTAPASDGTTPTVTWCTYNTATGAYATIHADGHISFSNSGSTHNMTWSPYSYETNYLVFAVFGTNCASPTTSTNQVKLTVEPATLPSNAPNCPPVAVGTTMTCTIPDNVTGPVSFYDGTDSSIHQWEVTPVNGVATIQWPVTAAENGVDMYAGIVIGSNWAWSEVSTLTVWTPPVFTSQPTDIIAPGGVTEASTSVTVSGSPAPVVTWYQRRALVSRRFKVFHPAIHSVLSYRLRTLRMRRPPPPTTRLQVRCCMGRCILTRTTLSRWPWRCQESVPEEGEVDGAGEELVEDVAQVAPFTQTQPQPPFFPAAIAVIVSIDPGTRQADRLACVVDGRDEPFSPAIGAAADPSHRFRFARRAE
jgi:hypothetical protein